MAALERMSSSIWRCSRAGAKTKAYIQKLFSAVCLTLPSIQPKVLGSRGKQQGQKLENQSQYDAHNFKFVAWVCGPLKLKGFKLLIMICNQPRISNPLLFIWGYAHNNMINQCYIYIQSFYFQTGGLLIQVCSDLPTLHSTGDLSILASVGMLLADSNWMVDQWVKAPSIRNMPQYRSKYPSHFCV